ncbi:MAG: hypothetical protein ACREN2_11425 [Candidatus Dormibacteria bacterium]
MLRLVRAVLKEQHDECAVRRRYFSGGSVAKLTQRSTEVVVETLPALENA